MTRIRIAAMVVAAGTGLGALLGVPVPAQAYESWQNWNDYATTAPDFATGPVTFEVLVDGPKAVCDMSFDGITLTAAPWVFTVDPTAPDWSPWGASVGITECDGTSDSVRVGVEAPFDIEGGITSLNGESGYQGDVSVRNQTSQPATATITAPSGKVVATTTVEPGGYAELTVPEPRKQRQQTAIYPVTVTSGEFTQVGEFVVAKDWSTMMSGSASFAPCSTIYWHLDKAASLPAGHSNASLRKDIRGSLARLSKVTGLTFIETDDRPRATLRFNWDRIGPSGLGGYSTLNGETIGEVTINSHDWWTKDANAGFGRLSRGPGGRGWLVIHEVMHALGLGHVDTESEVMASINRGQHRFGAGDLAGLRYLYPKAGCSS